MSLTSTKCLGVHFLAQKKPTLGLILKGVLSFFSYPAAPYPPIDHGLIHFRHVQPIPSVACRRLAHPLDTETLNAMNAIVSAQICDTPSIPRNTPITLRHAPSHKLGLNITHLPTKMHTCGQPCCHVFAPRPLELFVSFSEMDTFSAQILRLFLPTARPVLACLHHNVRGPSTIYCRLSLFFFEKEIWYESDNW